MLSAGMCLVVAAFAVLISFAAAQFDGWVRTIAWVGGIVAVGALILAARLALRPPVVLTLDAAGYRGRMRVRGQPFDGRWKDVRDVQISSSDLRLTTVTNDTQVFPLETVDARERVTMLREVHDRLNAAHGYTRFTFE